MRSTTVFQVLAAAVALQLGFGLSPQGPAALAAPPAAAHPGPKKKPPTKASGPAQSHGPAVSQPPLAPPPPRRPPSAPAPLTPPPAKALDLSLQRITLSNQLRVVLNPDPSLATVAITLAVEETQAPNNADPWVLGALSEQMLLQYPQAIGWEHGFRSQSVQGPDALVFEEVASPRMLTQMLARQAARLSTHAVTEQALTQARAFVQGAQRKALDVSSTQAASLRLEQLCFQGYVPYERRAASSIAPLPETPIENVQAYVRQRFIPNNAVLTIVGDFDPQEALALVRTYFEGNRAQAKGPSMPAPTEPEQSSQRSAVVRGEPGSQSAVMLGWPIYGASDEELAALEVLAAILTDRDTSGMPTRADRLTRINTNGSSLGALRARFEKRKGPSLFSVRAEMPAGADLGYVRKQIESALDAIARLGPSTEEMRQGWALGQLGASMQLQSMQKRAVMLATRELVQGDAAKVTADSARLFAVTKDDIRKAAGKFLLPSRRSVVELVPSKAGAPTQQLAQPPSPPQEPAEQASDAAQKAQSKATAGSARTAKDKGPAPKGGSGKDSKKKGGGGKAPKGKGR